jgi:RimJ/RimL family protein N-acetyltransferase
VSGSGSDQVAAQLSTYAYPGELRVDELLLRAPVDADIDIVAPAFRDPAVGGEASLPPVDAATLRVMMRDQLPLLKARGLLSPYVIEDIETGGLLGGLSLHHLDPMRDAVEIGYWLFVSARGRGVATRTVRAAVEHAFANGIQRVEAHVRVGNVASERVLERVGFVREGIKRRYLRRGGEERFDATLFSRLVDD